MVSENERLFHSWLGRILVRRIFRTAMTTGSGVGPAKTGRGRMAAPSAGLGESLWLRSGLFAFGVVDWLAMDRVSPKG